MIKKFRIKLNGVDYEVEVEELSSTSSLKPTQVTQPVTTAPVVETPKAQVSEPVKSKLVVSAGGITISAPMPGKILDVRVKDGDTVHAGDILFILEAMKMENEIVAPQDGIIASVHCTSGTTVSTGDILTVIQ